MKVAICLVVLIVLPVIARGDTVTLINNSSLNGSVLYDKNTFYIEAGYASGTGHYKIPRTEVIKDEINYENFNQGSPPPGVNAYQVDYGTWVAMNSPEPEVAPTNPKRRPTNVFGTLIGSTAGESSEGNDMVLLLNDKKEKGILVRITAKVVTLRKNGDKTEIEYQRNTVRLVSVNR